MDLKPSSLAHPWLYTRHPLEVCGTELPSLKCGRGRQKQICRLASPPDCSRLEEGSVWQRPLGGPSGCGLIALSVDDRPTFRHSQTQTAFGISQAKELMSYEEFQSSLMKEVELSTWLKKTVGRQLKQGNNMQSVRQRNSDYIGVKVALSVLAILFILSISEGMVEDTSFSWGFQTICSITKKQYGGDSPVQGLDISKMSRSQVELWMQGPPENSASYFSDEQTRQLLYLDLERAVFCNQILMKDDCVLPNTTASVWDQRASLRQIDQ
ncbi:unnamed protein product, partial [Polarella glacialis]